MMSSTRSSQMSSVHVQPPLHVGVERRAGEEIQDVENGTERLDREHQIDGFLDGRPGFTRAAVDEIGPGQDAVALGQLQRPGGSGTR